MKLHPFFLSWAILPFLAGAALGCGGAETTTTGNTGASGGTGGTGQGGTGQGGTGQGGNQGGGGSSSQGGGGSSPGPWAHLWSRSLGEGSEALAESLLDAQGNAIFAGSFIGTIDIDGQTHTSAGGRDALVIALDDDGNPLWSRSFGGPGEEDRIDAAAATTDGLWLAGGFQESVDFGGGPLVSAGFDDVFVTKVDEGGNHVWSRRFGSAGPERAVEIAADSGGNVVFAGTYGGGLDLGGGPLPDTTAAFLAKLDEAGDHVWSKGFADIDIQCLTVAGDGSIVLAGLLFDSADLGGGPLLAQPGDTELFVAKLDGAGAHQWSVASQSTNVVFKNCTDLDVDADGNVIFVGAFESQLSANTIDFGGGPLSSGGIYVDFIVKLDAGGNHVWSKSLGFGGLRGVATNGAGEVLAAGHALLSLQHELALARLDPLGEVLSSKTFPGEGQSLGYGMSVDAQGRALVGGTFTASVDLGGGALTIDTGSAFGAMFAP